MITDSDRSAARPPVADSGPTLYFIAPPSIVHPSSRASRLAIGGLAGACAWPLVSTAAPWLPEPLRFFVGWLVFTIGPGFVVSAGLARALDPLAAVIVMLAAGSAASPVVIDLLGRVHLMPLFPYLAAASAGAAAVSAATRKGHGPRTDRADAIACAGVVLLAAAIGAI